MTSRFSSNKQQRLKKAKQSEQVETPDEQLTNRLTLTQIHSTLPLSLCFSAQISAVGLRG